MNKHRIIQLLTALRGSVKKDRHLIGGINSLILEIEAKPKNIKKLITENRVIEAKLESVLNANMLSLINQLILNHNEINN